MAGLCIQCPRKGHCHTEASAVENPPNCIVMNFNGKGDSQGQRVIRICRSCPDKVENAYSADKFVNSELPQIGQSLEPFYARILRSKGDQASTSEQVRGLLRVPVGVRAPALGTPTATRLGSDARSEYAKALPRPVSGSWPNRAWHGSLIDGALLLAFALFIALGIWRDWRRRKQQPDFREPFH